MCFFYYFLSDKEKIYIMLRTYDQDQIRFELNTQLFLTPLNKTSM